MRDTRIERVLEAVQEDFKMEFEQELRKRLLDIATAEVEHTVREVSSRVFSRVETSYNQFDHSVNFHHTVKYHG